MGYSTDFNGEFNFNKPLTDKQFDYINNFSQSRRMGRDINVLMEHDKGENGLPDKNAKDNTAEEIYGKHGEFYVGDDNIGVIDYNTPPAMKSYMDKIKEDGSQQPGLWCQWIVEGDGEGQSLKWDGGEKFYNYVEWLKYLILNFFQPWGITLNGEVEWFGEESSDLGKIVVKDNVVEVFDGHVVYNKSK